MSRQLQLTTASVLAILVLATSALAGDPDSQTDDLALELATIEVMVEQLEEMPHGTGMDDPKRVAWASMANRIHDRLEKIVTYDTRDNLKMWVLIGRWACAEGVGESKSPYAHEPFFHIRRLRPDYQQDSELLKVMAKLNAIRNPTLDRDTAERFRFLLAFLRVTDKNNPLDQLYLGRSYENGLLWRNPYEAIRWYQRAAEAGNADALGELGEAYLYGQGPLDNDDSEGERLLLEAVDKGSASAAFKLGSHYRPHDFVGGEGNPEKCLEMFRIAAERGDHRAFSQVAAEYAKVGNGREALRWADGGDEPDATADDEAHFRWRMRRQRADSGGGCSYIKGEVFALGIGDVDQDLAKAKTLFEEASEKGTVKAAWALAAMYREGIGVEHDSGKAQQWESKASQTGFGSTGFGSIDFHRKQAREFAERLRASTPTD